MVFVKVTRKLGEILQSMKKALTSIPMTSAKSERVFLATGLFLTKFHFRMNDGAGASLTSLRQQN